MMETSGRMYKKVCDVKSVTHPNTVPLLENNYCVQMIEAGFAVLGLSQDGACTDLFQNLSVNSLKGDLSNATTFKLPLFSLDNTFKSMNTQNNDVKRL